MLSEEAVADLYRANVRELEALFTEPIHVPTFQLVYEAYRARIRLLEVILERPVEERYEVPEDLWRRYDRAMARARAAGGEG